MPKFCLFPTLLRISLLLLFSLFFCLLATHRASLFLFSPFLKLALKVSLLQIAYLKIYMPLTECRTHKNIFMLHVLESDTHVYSMSLQFLYTRYTVRYVLSVSPWRVFILLRCVGRHYPTLPPSLPLLLLLLGMIICVYSLLSFSLPPTD